MSLDSPQTETGFAQNEKVYFRNSGIWSFNSPQNETGFPQHGHLFFTRMETGVLFSPKRN